jgi:hypothetical protein
MEPEEFQKIKDEYKGYKELKKEQQDLRHTLETKVDTYKNLKPIADKLEIVDDELFYIQNESDFYRSLADSVEFERLQCDTEKKLYFFYGIVMLDRTLSNENRFGDDFVIFVPRNTKFKPFVKYYVMLWDLVDSREHILVPLKEYEAFKERNYVYDIGEEINIPFNTLTEYNYIRHNGDYDNYEEAYDRLRVELFRSYVHSETEEAAVRRMAKKFKL